MMYAITSYWMEFYKTAFWMHSSKSLEDRMLASHEDVSKMVCVSMQVFMNDKAKVEEVITLSRYVFMEGFVSYPMLPKPHKIIEKVPTVIRSRLQAWVTMKLLNSMIRILSIEGFQVRSVDKEIIWPGIFNMFTGANLADVFQLTSLFYLGYLKNKNETAEKNATTELYKKILDMENLRPKENTFLGNEDPNPETVGMHEFSPSWIKFLCAHSKKYLERIHGPSVL